MTKPNTETAMRGLIETVKVSMPLDMSQEELCSGACRGCPRKLVEFVSMELEDWENRLDQGEKPKLGEVQGFAKSCGKIYKALQINGLVDT